VDVTEEVVRNIAELVQLKVDDADIQQLTKGMQNILALADQMQAIDTDGIEPVSNPLDASQKLRPDAITEGNQRELFQSIAPATEAGLYLVPRVVE
jgi:aspartyl-tRNA(Asn)/glutamyl-tRNA(Gln) amidotransferase subunit C|tara:strand:+ start:8796 stop:9083 length:288 start_codon:yes stop_codon:yes gene_type:complete